MKGKEKAKEFEEEDYKVHVTGRNVLVTESMKEYAKDKLSKVERFTSARLIDAVVTMDIQKLEHRVDIVLKVDHTTISSHAATTDMYVSIDQAVEKLEKQLRRYKKKVREHKAASLAATDLKVNVLHLPAEEDTIDVNMEIEEQNEHEMIEKYRPHRIVKEETIPLNLLTYNEAVIKMEKSHDPFMIFRNEEDMTVNVIYRREDEHYGVVVIDGE